MIADSNLILNYRSQSLTIKLLILAVIASIIPGMSFLDYYDTLAYELEQENGTLTVTRQKYEKAKKKTSKLPELERKLSFTQSQLQIARKKLPEEFSFETVVHNTSSIVKELGITLAKYQPNKQELRGKEFKYVVMPIEVSIIGHYSQIIGFLDRIVHLETIINLENLKLSIQAPDPNIIKIEKTTNPEQQRRAKRNHSKVKAEMNMLIYRSLTDAEDSAIQTAPIQNKSKIKQKKAT